MPSRQPQGDDPSRSIYMPYGASGGGGQGGTYVFTDLAHLDRVISRWTQIRDDIGDDRRAIGEAIQKILPPADDKPSIAQAKAAQASLTKGQQHNQAMYDYANGFVEKLQATRTQYSTTEDDNIDAMRNAGPTS